MHVCTPTHHIDAHSQHKYACMHKHYKHAHLLTLVRDNHTKRKGTCRGGRGQEKEREREREIVGYFML